MPRTSRRYSKLLLALGLSLLTGFVSLPDATGHLLDLLSPTVSAASNFTVNSTGDGADSSLLDGVCNDGSGSCTLRAAIEQANAVAGSDTINFNIGSGVKTIVPTTDLPIISDAVVIDGTTQPGFVGTPIIEINGNNRSNTNRAALFITAGASTIRGLVINRVNNAAVAITTNGGNRIEGNFIGIDVTGSLRLPNSVGVIVNTALNTVGGTTAAARNVISGNNGAGIEFNVGTATDNLIEGNYIGVNAAGTAALGNGSEGIRLTGSGNRIGGTAFGAGNVISGNGRSGLQVGGQMTTVQGNFIGTNAAGTGAIPNGDRGISIFNSPNNVIGGPSVAARNVISGNFGAGISLDESGATGNVVQGNLIGTDISGIAPVPNTPEGFGVGNSFGGVFINRGSNNLIGGSAPGAANTIAFNGGAGVWVLTLPNTNIGIGNHISRNSIYGNLRLGIDLGPAGVTPNDSGDGDTDANKLQNFPAIISVNTVGGNTTVIGTLGSTANTNYELEFFANHGCHPSGNGEGARYLGTSTVTTDANGNAGFEVTLQSTLPAGQVVTATATDPSGNTSEFSPCNATGATGLVQFGATTMSVREDLNTLTIPVNRVGGSSGTLTVNFATADNTAIAGQDYTAVSGMLTFADGETSKTISLPIINDTVSEGTETMLVKLSSPSTPDVVGALGVVVRIWDPHSTTVLSLNGLSVNEGNTGTTNAVVTVNLSIAIGQTVTVNYQTFAMTATSGVDFQPVSGMLTFAPGVTALTVSVPIIGDIVDEPDENFRILLSNAVNAAVAVSSNPPVVLILDDDPLPAISVNDIGVIEGMSGTTDAVFTLKLSSQSSRQVSVNFATADGTATAGVDYQSATGTVVFNPGETSKTVTVRLIGDTVDEPLESFFLNLSNANNATLADSQAQATIINPGLTTTVNTPGDAADTSVGDGHCDTDGNLGNGDQCTLRAAIQETNSDPTVDRIGFGLPANTTISLTSPLDAINGNVIINGPGADLLTVQRSLAAGTPDFRIFTINFGKTVIISGLTIANGKVTGINNGGGVLNDGTLTMTNCNVYGNTADVSPALQGGRGGGIFNLGSLTLTNCHIGGTSAGQPNTGTMGGGGIWHQLGTLSMTGGSIAGNSGGGINSIQGSITLNGVAITSNTDRSFGGVSVGTLATIINCLIADNTVTLFGAGGIYNSGADVFVANTTISGNSSAQNGGGIFIHNNGHMTLTNVTVTNNRSDSDNTGGEKGGGIDHSFGVLVLNNTIVAGNFRGGLPSTTADDINGTVDTVSSFNLIGVGGSGGLTNAVNNNQVGVSNHGLGPLANNGGPTLTHALLSDGPAFDKGNNSFVTNPPFSGPPFTDQRGAGFNRVVDGPDVDATATVDIGAYEKQAVFPNLPDALTIEDTPGIVRFDLEDSGSVTGVAATSSNTTLVPNSSANISVTSAGSTWVLTINPVANLSGMSDITVTVNRPGGSMSSTFTLTVNPVNDAPLFTKGPDQSVNENDPAQTVNNWATSISPGPADESGQTVAFQIVSNSNPGLFAVAPAISSTGTLTYTPTPGVSGSAAIVVALSDNGGTANGGINISPTQTFNINVLEGGTLRFESFANYFSEGIGNAVITVIRTVGSAGEARINYATSPASPALPDYAATAGADYTPTSGTLIFPNGVTTQSFSVPIINDAFDENEEQVSLTLTNASGSGSLGIPFMVTLNITDNDPRPTITINDAQVIEGDSGTSNALFTVTLSGATELPVSASFGTVNSSAFAPSDYQTLNLTVTFNPGEATKTISVTVNGDTVNEPDEAFLLRFNSSTNADIIRFIALGTILNDDTPRLQFSSASYSVTESGGSTAITVQRLGDTSETATVDYATTDHSNPADFIPCTSPGAGFASSRCDFTTAIGTLRFAAGETSKTFNVLISNDNYVEGPETLELTLSNPTGGAVLSTPSSAVLSITDDLMEPPTNPIETSSEFVRSQYHDFLNREPDGPGLAFWTDNIEKCNDPARRPAGQTVAFCIDKQRESTAVAFFSSPEFQITGGFVYHLYKGSLTGSPNYDGGSPGSSLGRFPTSLEFMRDVSQVSEGIVVNNQISGAVVEANRNRLAADFVQRPEFAAKYGGLNHTLYVQELFNTTGISATAAEKQALVDGLTNGTETKASVLRKVVDGTVVISEGNVQLTTTYGQAFYDQEYRRVFVFMEYVGYLRRNPDTAGFIFWLGKLNQYKGDPFQAEMVRAFSLSPEYRSRFGQP